jgi:hypothetical protein
MLMGAGKGRIHSNGGAESVNAIGADRAGAEGRHIGHGADSAHCQPGCNFAENLVGFRVLREGNQGSFSAQNAGFFVGDGSDGRAQPFGVVERNVSNDGD